MLIFNTTYTTSLGDARGFVVWVHEVLLPRALASGLVGQPRLLHILSHKEADTECFSVQFEVSDSRTLHHWYTQVGAVLEGELQKIFEGRVVGFSTLMEVIE